MRKDMAKVIVERPRRGHADRYRPARNARKHDLSEEAPLAEGMRRPHIMNYEGKQLNENLNPLRRLLASKVGHRWDDVYSEINEHVKVDNAVQAHVRQHLQDMISLTVHRDDFGQVWEKRRFGLMLLSKGDLYVDDDGVIKKFKKQPKLKYDPGMKVYTIYRRRKHARSMKSYLGYSYFNCEFRMVEQKKVESLGIATKDIMTHFKAGTYADAVKEFDKIKVHYNHHLEERIYPKTA